MITYQEIADGITVRPSYSKIDTIMTACSSLS